MSAPNITLSGHEVPETVQTFDGFRDWFASLGETAPHASFVAGHVHIEMSPQSYDTHEPVVEEINHVLRSLTKELGIGRYYGPPSWISQRPHFSTEPDGFFLRWETLQSGRTVVNPERRTEMLGYPDFVLEVVSETSVKKDLVQLMEAYALAGVQEYWIADARADELVFRIGVLEGGRFVPQPAGPEGWVASPLWRRSFRLLRVTNPAGQPDFLLEARPE